MIPQGVDVDQLAAELDGDGVAAGLLGAEYPDLEPALRDALAQAEDQGFGSVGFAILDNTPPGVGDTRDVAQELLERTGKDTVIVRSPGMGAVVSHNYSRAQLEQAQHSMLGSADYVGGTTQFVHEVLDYEPPAYSVVSLVMAAAIAVVGAVSVWCGLRDGRLGSTLSSALGRPAAVRGGSGPQSGLPVVAP